MKIAKKVVVFVLSIAVALGLLYLAERLVVPKFISEDEAVEGNFIKEYYKETTNHEVVIIGDCEVYENLDPIYMWKEYGITSYIRGSAQQLAWQSYYMLEDTLRHETPKVVIYNVQALQHPTPQSEEYNRMTLDGMEWSKVKCNAIKASMKEGESFINYLFPLFYYHDRITKLNEDDFKYAFSSPKVTHNGYYMRTDVLPVSKSDVADADWLLGNQEQNEEEEIDDPWAEIETDDTDLDVKVASSDKEGKPFGEMPLEYLEKIQKLCKEKRIQLILMKAPSLSPIWHDTDEKQVTEFAEKYDLPYINFYTLINEIGIDYEKDTYDGGLHMNLQGADKLSKYLGKVLVEEYGIQDYRNEKVYEDVYKEKVQFYEEMKKEQDEEIKKYGELRDYSAIVKRMEEEK